MAVGKHNLGIGVNLTVLQPGHAVVHAPRQIANLGMQRTAEGNVHFLEAPTDTKERNAAGNAGLDQRQRHGVAIMVVGFVSRVGLDPEARRMDIGTCAGQQNPIDLPQQRFDVGNVRCAGKHQRQRLRHFGNGLQIALSNKLHIVPFVDDLGIPDHADHRLRHTRHRYSPPRTRGNTDIADGVLRV